MAKKTGSASVVSGVDCCRGINVPWEKIFVAAVVIAIISYAIHTIGAILTMGYYTDPANFALWSDLMMPDRGPPGTAFFVYSLLFSLIAAMLYGYVYTLVRDSIPEKGVKKGMCYGFILFLVSTMPGTLSMILMFALPGGLILSWTVEGLAAMLAAGIVIEKIVK